MDPFLPWPGSKAKCSKAILQLFPRKKIRTYYEPFLGSGAIFFAMQSGFDFDRAKLSDSNSNLIHCFRTVRDNPEHVKRMLEFCLERNSEEFYASMRSQLGNPSVFIYVMRAGFSSMYRENLKGQFNVPWRKQDFVVRQKRISYDVTKIDDCSWYMQTVNAELEVADWQEAIHDAGQGDLVYLDPPYIPFTENGFTNYQATGFKEGDHVFLRTAARQMAERGAFVALSNSLTDNSIRIYGEPYTTITVSNSVKSTAKKKGTREEGLWLFNGYE